MRKYLIILLAPLLLATVAWAAPQYRVERTLLPEATNTYEIGTTTARWLRGFFGSLNTNATSTGTKGWDISDGCYAINGTCVGGSSYDWQKETHFGALALTPTTTIPLWAKSAIYASSTLTVQGTSTLGLNVSIGGIGGFSDAPTKLSNPADLPASSGRGSSFSPNGQYLAIAHDTTPYVTIYKRTGDTFTKLANPASLPASNAQSTAFSGDSTYLAVAHDTSPYITIYKRSGDVFTKLTDPVTLPTGNAKDVSFSTDGQYLSVAHVTTPFLTIYKRSGDTFTKLANPANLPFANSNGVAFSPTGTYLSITSSITPFVNMYKRVGNTFTKLADPASLPADIGRGTAFSPDGLYLSVAHDVTPFVTIYKRAGDVFTKLSNPATLPAAAGFDTAFSPDGTYLSVVHTTTPFVTIYKRSGDVFTKLSDPTLPAGNGRGTGFSPDGTYLAVAHLTTPFVTIYKGSGTATHALELAYGAGNATTSPLDGLSFGKDTTLYRSAPGILGLSAGGTFSIENGQLLVGNNALGALSPEYNARIDATGNISVINPTLAITTDRVQSSPVINLRGSAYNTGTAISNSSDWRLQNITSAANPITSVLNFAHDLDGAGYLNMMTLSNLGSLTLGVAGSGGGGSVVFNGFTSGSALLGVRAVAGTPTVVLPDVTGELSTTYVGTDPNVGTDDTYTISATYPPTAYRAGQMVILTVVTANTGAATLDYGAGAVTIVKRSSTTLANGDIPAGGIAIMVHNGTNLVLLNPVAH